MEASTDWKLAPTDWLNSPTPIPERPLKQVRTSHDTALRRGLDRRRQLQGGSQRGHGDARARLRAAARHARHGGHVLRPPRGPRRRAIRRLLAADAQDQRRGAAEPQARRVVPPRAGGRGVAAR